MHDCNGKPLEVGDEIIFRATIKNTSANEEYCNIQVEGVHPAKPFNVPCVMASFWFNAAQVEKVEKSD